MSAVDRFDHKAFGERLKRALVLREVKQQWLADTSGVDKTTISLYIHGLRESPALDLVVALSETLQIHLDWLLLGRGPDVDSRPWLHVIEKKTPLPRRVDAACDAWNREPGHKAIATKLRSAVLKRCNAKMTESEIREQISLVVDGDLEVKRRRKKISVVPPKQNAPAVPHDGHRKRA